jgi:hypothetical protein
VTDIEEDRRAVAALVHRLRAEHGDTRPLGKDAEPFAAEFIAALRVFGWRPVCVTPAEADWRRPAPRGAPNADVIAALKAGDYRAAYAATHAEETSEPAQGPVDQPETGQREDADD